MENKGKESYSQALNSCHVMHEIAKTSNSSKLLCWVGHRCILHREKQQKHQTVPSTCVELSKDLTYTERNSKTRLGTSLCSVNTDHRLTERKNKKLNRPSSCIQLASLILSPLFKMLQEVKGNLTDGGIAWMLKAVVGHSRENFVKFGSLTTKFTVIVSPNTPNDLLFACCHQNSAEKKYLWK